MSYDSCQFGYFVVSQDECLLLTYKSYIQKNSTEYYVNISVTISKNFSYNAMRVNLALVFSPFSINQTLECLKNKRFVYHESLTFINDVKHIKWVKMVKFDLKDWLQNMVLLDKAKNLKSKNIIIFYF